MGCSVVMLPSPSCEAKEGVKGGGLWERFSKEEGKCDDSQRVHSQVRGQVSRQVGLVLCQD